MSKTYLVDSENVGGSWIDLLKEDGEFLIFYTGHSPRIDYEHAISLINAENKPEFIQCYEGNNALDFQLVSYLGYLLRSEERREMIIVSNDTGFDAVVHFWTERGLDIKRLATNFIEPKEPETEEVPVSCEEIAAPHTVKVTEKLHGVERKELYTVINCFGVPNSSYIHLAYIHFYGNKKGGQIYNHMKAEKFAAPPVPWKRETKVKKYCELIFRYCNNDKVSIPTDIYAFLCTSVTAHDDKTTMQKKMTNKYGDKAAPLHKILTPFYKSIAKVK